MNLEMADQMHHVSSAALDQAKKVLGLANYNSKDTYVARQVKKKHSCCG